MLIRLLPILDLRGLNRTLQKCRFKILTLKLIVLQIQFEDWFVIVDLKDTSGYVLLHDGVRFSMAVQPVGFEVTFIFSGTSYF